MRHLRGVEHVGVRRVHRQLHPGQRRRPDRVRAGPGAGRDPSRPGNASRRPSSCSCRRRPRSTDPVEFVPLAEFERGAVREAGRRRGRRGVEAVTSARTLCGCAAPCHRCPCRRSSRSAASWPTFGIEHVGVASADVLVDARRRIHHRIDADLHDGMGFTFRNPGPFDRPDASSPGCALGHRRRSLVPDHRRPGAPGDGTAGPGRARYAWVDHYAPLRAGLRSVARSIRRADERAVAFADDNSMVDRAIAHRAGLGWFGKNANLLLPGLGSWFVLGSIVTTAAYEPNTAASPTAVARALVASTDVRPGRSSLPASSTPRGACRGSCRSRERCRSNGGSSSATGSTGVTTARTSARSRCGWVVARPIDLDDASGAWVDALALLDADDEWIADRYAHWYVADRDYRWVRRNALVVIGNVGEPDDTRCHQVLDRYRSGPDPVLAEHAQWALDRLTSRCRA